MKINLKKLVQQKETLIHVADAILVNGVKKNLKDLLSLIEEIELDVEMCGESIIELDKDRLDAIEEKNKFLNFMKNTDEI